MYSDRGDAALPAFGFPHSGIRGSKAVQRLTVAYRSRPRPSSTPDAKASTVCPSYLDGDRVHGARRLLDPVIFHWPTMQFSRSGEGATRGLRAGLSKLNSMRGELNARP